MSAKHVVASLMLSALAALPLAASANAGLPEPGSLTVTARSEVQVAPNTATMSARLWEVTQWTPKKNSHQKAHAASQAARDRLEKRMAEVILALEAMEIDANQIQSGNLIVRQEVDYQRLGQNGAREPLVRTRVERPLTLTLNDLDLIPTALDSLSSVGIDALDGIEYDLTQREQYYDAALADAVKKARKRAEMMAQGLDSHLGRVLDARPQHPMAQPKMARNVMMMEARSDNGAMAPEYRAGQLDVSASVTVTWELTHVME